MTLPSSPATETTTPIADLEDLFGKHYVAFNRLDKSGGFLKRAVSSRPEGVSVTIMHKPGDGDVSVDQINALFQSAAADLPGNKAHAVLKESKPLPPVEKTGGVINFDTTMIISREMGEAILTQMARSQGRTLETPVELGQIPTQEKLLREALAGKEHDQPGFEPKEKQSYSR